MKHEHAAVDTSRFDIQRRLDGGGFGSVFVVFDRLRGQQLALKRLERLDPGSIYRFKQEFRALADISHDNLVKLHELFVDGPGWSFTMELVDGVPFDEWCWGALGHSDARPAEHSTKKEVPNRDDPASDTTLRQNADPQLTEWDVDKLRHALRQLALGVSALHQASILHRDLKPSNVLVDHNGRVVILDFGLVATGVVDSHESMDGATAGTPAYMSPEQARGAPLSSASDWYSVGLMVYEALTGGLPFDGSPAEIMAAKALHEAPDPRSTCPGLPDDLVELSLRLLRRDPAERPTGEEILAWLDVEPLSSRSRAPAAQRLVGREHELAELHRAFAATEAGNTVVAYVRGPSGYGKTTLIRHFLGQVSERRDVVVLTGRCYERESVPFKAFDELIDSLYHFLRRMKPVEAATFTPRHAQGLVRLFPTLGRLTFMNALQSKAPDDPHELRRKAFKALRELFTRLSDARHVVLFVDDVQWGDSDSAALLRDLLAPPEVPPLLLVVGDRGDGSDENELVQTLRAPRAADSAWEVVDIGLGPLTGDAARELAQLMLGGVLDSEDLAPVIAREADGSPLFIAELARRAGAVGAGGISVQGMVAERVAELPLDARNMLELMACSERPLRQAELETASNMGSNVVTEVLDNLRAAHLVNVVVSDDGIQAFEMLHDKMRAAVRTGLSASRKRDCHACLARTLSASLQTNPEILAYHFAEAGDAASALAWTERASERAMDGVAFDHVVQLHQRAMTFAPAEARITLGEKLAAALARAGRGEESARAYLKVAAGSDGEAAHRLRQAAAEQYLRAGYVEEALETFGPLLSEAGLGLPRTASQAVASLLWHRSILKLRGLRFQERDARDIDENVLRAIDFCWSVGTGLAGIDLVRSARYYVMSLQMSLKCGEPHRIARSLSIEAIMKALESTAGVKVATDLSKEALQIAQRVQNPHALGWATAAHAVVAWGNTDIAECRRLAEEAVDYLRQRSLETFREIGSMQVWFSLNATFLMGDLKTLAEKAPACAREARTRGDRYTHSTVRAYILPYLWASRDKIMEARQEADEAIAVWESGTWYHQHWAWLRAMCFLDLYEGNGTLVWQRTQKHRPSMQRAMQLRVRTLRTELEYLEGRGALELMLVADDIRARQRLVEDRVRRLEAEDNGLATGYALLLRAGLSAQIEAPKQAASAFARTGELFEGLGMPLYAAAARLREAQCLALNSDTCSAELEAKARALLEAHGVVHPGRFTDMLVPRVALDAQRPAIAQGPDA